MLEVTDIEKRVGERGVSDGCADCAGCECTAWVARPLRLERHLTVLDALAVVEASGSHSVETNPHFTSRLFQIFQLSSHIEYPSLL